MEIAHSPQILFGSVMHKRFFERVNQFTYKIYYLCLPLSCLQNPPRFKYLKFNTFGALSFYNKDHGARDGGNLQGWARGVLKQHKIDYANGEIVLITMPRVFGYVFNPVSFWYCYDKEKKLRVVICEVNNTFGESHSYICTPETREEITKDIVLQGEKVFHVSPFMQREGGYEFRFTDMKDKMAVWIDYFDVQKNKKLVTAVSGDLTPMSDKSLAKAFWGYPFITFKAIFLIHWQAIKLVFKKIKYVPKPEQLNTRVTTILKTKDKA